MIVRILGEGQLDVPVDSLDELNQLDTTLQHACEAHDEAAFHAALAALLDRVRALGSVVPDDHLGPSELVFPSRRRHPGGGFRTPRRGGTDPRMSRSRFRPDHGLVARMSFTLFLIGALYVAVVALLIAANVQIGVVLVIAAIFLFSQYFFSDKLAFYGMGGKIVTPEQAPELHGIVDRLCALADMPKPRVAIADTDMPNAFATGRNPKNAVVCATTGIMRRLDTEELEGVLSHELSHVAHRDVAVMTFASFLGMVAGLITRFAFYSGLFGGFDEDDNNNGGVSAIFVIIDRLDPGVRRVVPADPHAVALPRAVGRPIGCAAHRPAVGARVGAAEGQRRLGPDPEP